MDHEIEMEEILSNFDWILLVRKQVVDSWFIVYRTKDDGIEFSSPICRDNKIRLNSEKFEKFNF